VGKRNTEGVQRAPNITKNAVRKAKNIMRTTNKPSIRSVGMRIRKKNVMFNINTKPDITKAIAVLVSILAENASENPMTAPVM